MNSGFVTCQLCDSICDKVLSLSVSHSPNSEMVIILVLTLKSYKDERILQVEHLEQFLTQKEFNEF